MLRLSLSSLAAANCFAQGAIQLQLVEIANGPGVVYAVTTADVNGDRGPDIVVIDNSQLLWFESPSWTKHVVAERITTNDNVAPAPHDIDGDGRMDFALGADWQAANTASGGNLHWVSSKGKVHWRGGKTPRWQDGPGARILVCRILRDSAEQSPQPNAARRGGRA